MKEFNLELAKAGHTVQTRDGRPARIIDYNRKYSIYRIVALIELDKKEEVQFYTVNGEFNGEHCHPLDLVMVSTKKEGYINLYKSSGITTIGNYIYESEQEAKNDGWEEVYITTIKIEWEE